MGDSPVGGWAGRGGLRRRILLGALAAAMFHLVAAPALAVPDGPRRPIHYPPRPQAGMVPSSGAVGPVQAFPAFCDVFQGTPQIALHPPLRMAPSYDTVGREAQRVWWQPRVWWEVGDGTYASTPWNTWEWHSSYSQSGNNPGGMYPVLMCHPGRPCIQGAAGEGTVMGSSLLDWTSEAGVVRDYNWAAIATLNLGIARTFVVENIYYWEANASQPQDGWDSEFVATRVGDFQVPSGTVCAFN